MKAKITLILNQEIIDKAKKYASDKKLSLSSIVESYLQSLTSKKNETDFEIFPFVKSIATGITVPDDINYEEEYAHYLLEKYK